MTNNDKIETLCKSHRDLRKIYLNLKDLGYSSNDSIIRNLLDEMNEIKSELEELGEMIWDEDGRMFFKPENRNDKNLEDLYVYRLTAT